MSRPVSLSVSVHTGTDAPITHKVFQDFVTVEVGAAPTEVALLISDPQVLDRLADVIQDAAFGLRAALADKAAAAA